MQPVRLTKCACATVSVLAIALASTSSASAETIDGPNVFKSKVLKCLHPTISPDKASFETVKPPETSGDTTITRVKVFYQGMVGGKNALEADLMVRQAGSIRQMKVNVLSDTGTTLSKCQYTAGWTDF